MTLQEMQALFEKFAEGVGDDAEFLMFERIKNPAHRRKDICGFIMLDAAVPNGSRDMVSAAEHDEIYLDVDAEALAAVATEELIRDLVRCGVRYSGEFDCLAMFV